jgi:N-acetylmuramoyl-L-alanine amidase
MGTVDSPSQDQKPIKKVNSISATFYYLAITAAVAFVLATLFTAWTPGGPSFNAGGVNLGFTPGPTSQASNFTPLTTSQALRVGIVAGHWKNDSGSVCPDGLQEAQVNLEIASLVQKILSEKGYSVELLAEFDERLQGYQATALVSIHADSCDFINELATGFKVAPALANKRPDRSERLTNCLKDRYGRITGMKVHGTSITIDMTSYHAFGEIDASTPAAIIETGFLNLDRQFLTEQPQLAAQGIASGIVCFLNNESISPATPPGTQTAPTSTP